MHRERLVLAQKVVLHVTAIVLVPQTISVTCKLGSAPAGSRPAVVSVTFALQVTGDSQRVVRAAVITTRHLANHRRVCALTVNTALQGRTVKCARSVTMETPQVEQQTIAVGVNVRVVAVETSLAQPVFWIGQLFRHLQFVTLVKRVTLENSVRNAMTVTMATHLSQAAAASSVHVITTLTQLTSATVTGLLGGASLACSIPLVLVVSVVNRVTMVMPFQGIAQSAFVTVMERTRDFVTPVITRQASVNVCLT